MKLKKQVSCILAAALLSLTVFSGCSGGEQQGNIQQILNKESTVQSSVPQSSDVPSQVSQDPSPSQPGPSGQSSVPSSTSTITPAMWKVEDNNGHYCYMFGTIHAADDEAIDFPDYFENAYNDSQSIAVEIDISDAMNDPGTAGELLKYLTYSDGTKITDHISKQTYDAVVAVIKSNSQFYYDHMYDSYTPMAWSSILDSLVMQKAGLSSDKGVDVTCINRAKNDGKEVLEVESMEYQLKMFERMSDKVGELLLVNYTSQEGFDSQVNELQELLAAWKNGDPVRDEIDTSQLAFLDKETREALEYYIDEMFNKRNPSMADKVESYLRDGKKVLVMVGAAHFYADNGLVNLMRQRGYTVTRISPPATKDLDVVGAV